jgi:glyoxylase-like metal-dependent hydrolase (beta-lactamase superfamily II)
MFQKMMFTVSRLGAVAVLASMAVLAQAPGGAPGGPAGAPGGGRGGAQSAAQATQQIKPGLFVITGAGGNTTVRVTPEGLIVVDTKNLGDQFYTALAEQIKGISPQPVKFVVITHHHQDHSGNTQKFLDAGATVVAHENEKTALATYAPQQGKPAAPSVTYAKDYTIKLGGAEADVHYYGHAHTSGDSFVYFPDLKVVAGGDSIVGAAPNVDFPFGGSAVDWVKVLDSVEKLDFDTVVPGHSAPGQTLMTRADFETFRTKLTTVVTRARELVKSGTPKEELLAKIKTDDIGWNLTGPQWNNPQRLDAFYAELSK